MAKKIETETDVIEWATAIEKAKGERFTPLSKSEQLVIARYVMAHGPAASERENAPEPLEVSEAKSATQPNDTFGKERSGVFCTPESYGVDRAENADPIFQEGLEFGVGRSVSRGEAYRKIGLDAQQVFDKFLEWGRAHPKETMVMDFMTGRQSIDAAFSYWLCEKIQIQTGIQKGL